MTPTIEEMRIGFMVQLHLVATGVRPPCCLDANAAADLLAVLKDGHAARYQLAEAPR
jgi:hypothetical protein